ncbi:MAG: cytochrome P450 [Acidimicrobiales bacterium]
MSDTEAPSLPQIDLLNGYWYAADPTPTYRWMRHHAPVYRDDINGLWGISRYRDIVEIEKQPSRYSNRNSFRPMPTDTHDDQSMISFDDPRHQTQRRLVARRFTPRAVANHHDEIAEVVAGLVDEALAAGSVDAVEALAAPLPAMMIAKYLGFGIDRWREVKHWSTETIPLGGGIRYQNDTGIAAAFEFAVACTELIAEKRANPTDDMVSVWCHTEIDGVPMSDDSIIAECLLLVDGGAETTRTVIASTLWDLVQHPDQLARLRENPAMIGESAVEEFIRWVTPVLNMARLVTEDHELAGQQLHAGDQLILMYSSANRDETVFDAPDTYDVGRTHNNHVAFGFGSHFCLGSSLARLEIRLFFEEFLRRVEHFEITPGTAPNRIPGAFVRGVENLHLDLR